MFKAHMATAVVFLAGPNAFAGIVTFGGSSQSLTPPFTVQTSGREMLGVAQVFPEKIGYELASPITLDITDNSIVRQQVELTPITIPAGAYVDSYFVYIDSPQTADVLGSLIFDTPILGIIVTQQSLQGSHPTVGNPLVTYPVDGSAVASRADASLGNGYDTYTLDNTRQFVSFNITRASDGLNYPSVYRNIRIITAASVPEPSAALQLSLAIAAILANGCHRRLAER